MKDIISNVAQVILIVILLPFMAIICAAVLGNNAPSAFVDFLLALVGKIPLCDIWVDVLANISSGMTQSDYIDSMGLVILKGGLEAVLMAACVHATNQFFLKILEQNGLPIFSTMLGVVLSSVLLTFSGVFQNVLMELGVILIMAIGIIIMFKAVFYVHEKDKRDRATIFGFSRIFILLIDGAMGIIISSYVAVIVVVMLGKYKSIRAAIGTLVLVTIILMVAAMLRLFLAKWDNAFD